MHKSGFYPRLAMQNIVKNRRFYLPYILTCAGCTAMFYIMLLLSSDQTLLEGYGGRTVVGMLSFGSVIIAIFSLILIFYTNSFLMKRRRRELGLWNILGMEKRHIAGVLLFETFFLYLISLLFGLLCGVLMSKLLSLLLMRLILLAAPFGLLFSASSCLLTGMLFGAIFLLTLVFNLLQIRLARPVELLSSGRVAEKQPRTRWLLAVIGALAMAGGYGIALTVTDALTAIATFFIAVLLVIIGTYCLFIAGSIAVLKLLRRNKRFYYRTGPFVAVSGMIHRMKQNGAGLASICILCTMILVTVSTTVSLYSGIEDMLRDYIPSDLHIDVYTPETEEDTLRAVERTVAALGREADIRAYHTSSLSCTEDEAGMLFAGESDTGRNVYLNVIPYADYHAAVTGSAEGDGRTALFYSATGERYEQLTLFGLTLVTTPVDDFPFEGEREVYLDAIYWLALGEDVMAEFARAYTAASDGGVFRQSYVIDLDSDGTNEEKLALAEAIHDAVRIPTVSTYTHPDGSVETTTFYNAYVTSRAENRDSLITQYGGFLFLGLFLGTLFLMATVLIIYYKQISEGYEDRERFVIMQQVGMSRAEVRGAIRMQVLMVFFLPIGVALLHVCGAFRLIALLLQLFSLSNVGLFMLCTLATAGVFALIYGAVYLLTARTYYKIVS